jgi:hypothetical protein
MALPARAPDCHLEIVFNGPPRRPYVVVGQLWTDASSPQVFYGRLDTNNAAPVQRLIQQACVAGAHGLMSVTVQTHRPWGKGWKSTQAVALAFAYVDASGRVLPPPSGPQVEIPVSAFGP